VDIEGTGEEQENIRVKSIALRADIDGLKMKENNPTLSYCSKTEYAHMCGHDGHTATLVLAACILQKNRDKIPKGCKVRLLFQPAEETPGGAEPMIKDGALEGIDEVFGMHNIPNFKEGEIRIKEGPVMASICFIDI
jgi:amidohydrolase